MDEIVNQARRWIESIGGDTARVESVTDLPPSPDGRTYRFEVVMRLPESLSAPPGEDDIRSFADKLRREIDTMDIGEWDGPDELYIQLYAPDRDTDAGACGTAHWLSDGGYESVEARPYLF